MEKRASAQFCGENAAQAAQAAVLILQICAFFHHSNISEVIFQSAAEESRKESIDSELVAKLSRASTLLDYNLLTLDNDMISSLDKELVCFCPSP